MNMLYSGGVDDPTLAPMTRSSLATYPLLCALAFTISAATANAQPPCQAGEVRVDFESGTISEYTVPTGVETLRITAAGGQGGDHITFEASGGRGAVLTGTLAVTAGAALRILVGTAGGQGTQGGGGGGGASFVGVGAGPESAFSPENVLVAAGGGGGAGGAVGGAGGTPDGGDGDGDGPFSFGGGGGDADGTGGAPGANAGEGGGAAIGDDGEDGVASSDIPGAGGGGGAGGDGGNATVGEETAAFGGQAAIHGGAGGMGARLAHGGFGGGGAGAEILAGGGGGGYAGGGGGGAASAGGGSSFFAGEASSMEANNDGDGEVFFCVPPTPALTLAPSSLDFGNVVVGTSKDVTATLENTGTAPATNLSVSTTSGEFIVDEDATDCTNLDAGDSCTVSVTFTPTDVGSAEATLQVDSTEGVTATLDLTGSGVPPPTWTISGTITDASDAPLSNVTVHLTGTAEASVTTGDDGSYTFQELADGGSYTVTPSLSGYTFNPAFAKLDALARNETANFTAAAVELTITGTVVDQDCEPLEGVSVALSGDSQADVTTAADGAFAFDGLTWGGTYTIAPTHADYEFNPASRELPSLEEDAQVSFTATQLTAVYTRYFAEGAIGSFFDTTFALFNPSEEAAAATLTFAGETGQVVPHTVTIPAGAQVVVNPEMLLPEAWVGFATTIEADQVLVTSRRMRWDDRHYGSHESAGVAMPQPEWWFTEGATGEFQLFYLLYNPNDTPAQVDITYYRGGGQTPVPRSYTAAPHARLSIFVNTAADGVTPDPELGATEVAAHIVSSNGVPIVAERALYLTTDATQPLTAGTLAPAVPAPATSWHFAEGATFFDLFLLLANPSAEPVEADVHYLLPTGAPIPRTYTLEPQSRRTILVNAEDAALAETPVAITVQSETPILAERAMWFGINGPWKAGHTSTGAIRPAARWGLAGLALGGTDDSEAYVLVANPNNVDAEATLTLIAPDGARAPVTVPIGPWNRTTLRLRDLFPNTSEEAVAVLVESTGGESPVPLVVEGAAYASPGGQPLATASATPALPLPE